MNNHKFLDLTTQVVSEHLLAGGQIEKAASLLSLHLAQNPAAPSVYVLSSLARISYNLRGWNEAAELWGMVLLAEPQNLEALLKRAHCLIELGEFKGAEVHFDSVLRMLNRCRGESAAAWKEEWLDMIHKQICVHFTHNNAVKGERLTRLCALPGSYTEGILQPTAHPDEDRPLSDERILAKLNLAFENWRRNPHPPLPGKDEMPRADESLNASRPSKVLLVLRKYFLDRVGSREHELAFFFQRSAEASGHEVMFFPAEPFLNTATVTPDQQYAELDRLARLILSWHPDLVVFDNLCMPGSGGAYLGRKAYQTILSELKARQTFALIAHYPDAWASHSESTIRFVESFADVIWHQNSAIKPESPREDSAIMFRAPTPYLEDLFQRAEDEKDIDAAFVGGVFDYNYPRAIWLTLMRSRQMQCQVFLANHTTSGCAAGKSVEEYAAFMSRLKISVNFSSRNSAKKIMTGRTWESIIARCLLLEEDNDEIKNYFVPWVHYIPFSRLDELEAYLGFFLRRRDARERITQQAYRWFEQHFSKEKIWSSLACIGTSTKNRPPRTLSRS